MDLLSSWNSGYFRLSRPGAGSPKLPPSGKKYFCPKTPESLRAGAELIQCMGPESFVQDFIFTSELSGRSAHSP
jgi:hypothetical protein